MNGAGGGRVYLDVRLKRLMIAAASGVALGTPICVYILAEGALHIWERGQPAADAAQGIALDTHSRCQDVEVRAPDGVKLSAWLFRPEKPNGAVVLLLHGVGDSRAGMMGYARFLLAAGYAVLAPDSRGHGQSGGTLITYGLKEAADIRAWADYALGSCGFERLYGLGVSMGAANLLESLRGEPRFRAVVAESSFASFEKVAYYRLGQSSRLPHPALWPLVKMALGYTWLRYKVDLRHASPVDVVRETQVPVLLIHGSADTNIPPRDSEALHAANPRATELWMVDGAGHVEVLARRPEEYARRVVAWFEGHTQLPVTPTV